MGRSNFTEGPESVSSIIAEGCTFNGSISVNGSIRVDGQFEGKLTVSDSLVIGKGGKVRAEVETKLATIAGSMTGEIHAKEGVKLQGGSRFEGSIFSKNLVIEEGVYFDGGCWRSRENRSGAVLSRESVPEKTVSSEKPVGKGA